MKKIFLFLSILFILGVTMNSCISEKVAEIVKEPDPDPDPDPSEKKTYKVSTAIELTQFARRTTMGSSQIGLFLYNGNNAVQSNIPLSLTSGGGQIELTTSYTDAYSFGYFPYSSTAFSGAVYSGAVSSQQDQVVTNSSDILHLQASLDAQLLMVSVQSSIISFGSQTARLGFRNVFSLLRFHVTKSADFTGFTNQRVKSFEIYVSNRTDTLTPLSSYKLAGSYTMDLKSVAYSGDFTPDFSSSYASKITGNATTSAIINETDAAIIWAVIPPLNISPDDKLVLRLETEDDAGLISYSSIHTFSDVGLISRNELKPYSIVLTKDNVSSDYEVKSLVDEPANSYVVSEPGIYEISTKTPTGKQIAGGNNATWLWASKAGGGASFEIEDLISNISYASDTIQFRVGSGGGALSEGNVVLALRDAANNILWTWHVWITDKPRDMQYDNNNVFLDRNIGALSAGATTDNFGFVYQWGRKDPFFGSDGSRNETTATLFTVARNNTIVNSTGVSWTDSNVAKWAVQSTPGDTATAKKYPMRFISNNRSLSSNEAADWLSVSIPDLWDDNKKTDTDPCPYGYKVPGKNTLKTLHDAYSDYKAHLSTPSTPVPSIWFYYGNHRYWQYSYSNVVSVWPAAGMRQGRSSFNGNNGAQLLYSGTDADDGKCIYWTSSPIKIGGSTLSGGSHRIYTSGNMLYSEDDYGDNADAYPVRCVKMANP
ncbi:MAG: hypothetical protein LBV74_23220 [Tannerella sp.]|jgi:hypothetical protein|nr:hypothetical protein [Tannerella sp.]